MRFPNTSFPSQESILKGRFAPSGRIEGFTAEIGASGSYCPQHVTLPVDVTYFDISEHSAPSPFLVHGRGGGEGGCTARAAPCCRGWLKQPPACRGVWLCREQSLTQKAKRETRGNIHRPSCFMVVIVIASLVTSSLLLLLVWRGTELGVFLLTCARCSQRGSLRPMLVLSWALPRLSPSLTCCLFCPRE